METRKGNIINTRLC